MSFEQPLLTYHIYAYYSCVWLEFIKIWWRTEGNVVMPVANRNVKGNEVSASGTQLTVTSNILFIYIYLYVRQTTASRTVHRKHQYLTGFMVYCIYFFIHQSKMYGMHCLSNVVKTQRSASITIICNHTIVTWIGHELSENGTRNTFI